MRTAIDGLLRDTQTALDPRVAGRYAPGTVLSAKYRFETLLGEGGMGSVWRANNVLLDLPVAIKLIRADLDRGALRARLQLEARSAARLGHPSIVRVFDVGESEHGDPFIVMEYLRGETLAQLISRGQIPAARAVQLLLPIVDALAMAHARGIVHRDLKPDNVMIALEEQGVCPKILDFGVAKLTDPRDSDFKLTEFGAVVGSPEYMSPEQARGLDDIDASTDIWSTCVVLYEAIAGRTPFSANNLNALLRGIVEDAPKPLSAHGPDHASLWQILERGLEKDRARRYAKISDLGQALAAWLLGQGVTEDACGNSLESKWFGRKSDTSGLSHPLTPQRSPESLRAELRDSQPDSTGVARGPFTKTIQPNVKRRTRALGTAIVGLVLFGASSFALGHSPRAAAPLARVAAKVASTPAIATPAIATPAIATPKVARQADADKPPASPKAIPLPEASGQPEGVSPPPSAAKAGAPGVRVTRSTPIHQVRPVAPPSPSAQSAPAMKAERTLDLLPPY